MSALLCEPILLAGDVAPADVERQVSRILRDRRFQGAERSSRFLQYVVEKTLAGEGDEIKEVVIAMEVYGRSPSYDPKADSVVRVEASRLRARLRDYYEGEGRRDEIRISIPLGAYVPRFERISVENDEPPAPPAAPPSLDWEELEPAPPARHGWKLTLRLTLALALVAAGWTWRSSASVVPKSPAPAISQAALTAWREGTDLLAQDPHTAISDHGAPRTLLRAIEKFEAAVAEAPVFARGWASLAESYEYAAAYVGRDHKEDTRRAENAARRALELDPKLPQAHAMMGLVQFYLRWNLNRAEVSYRRAIALDPNNAYAIVEFVDLLRETGRLREAAEQIQKARVRLPASVVLAAKEAEVFLDQHQIERAITAAREALVLQRSYGRALWVLGMAYEAGGNPSEALVRYEQALAIDPNDRRVLPVYGHLLGKLGRRTEALAVAKRLVHMNDRVRTCGYQLAVVYAGLGDREEALRWLEQAFARKQAHVPFAAIDPRLAQLRTSRRFRLLVAQTVQRAAEPRMPLAGGGMGLPG